MWLVVRHTINESLKVMTGMGRFIARTSLAVVLIAGSGCGDGVTAPSPMATLFTLSGTVNDIATARAIPGASMSVAGLTTITDSAGNYSLRLPAGNHMVTFAASGYSSEIVTIMVAGDTTYRSRLAIDTPNPPTTSNLTGTWSGTGSYPNTPFRLFLAQSGNTIVGYYEDQHDQGRVAGTSGGLDFFTLVVDFGDGSLRLECNPITSPRQIQGVQRTSTLGNRPYPFTMTR